MIRREAVGVERQTLVKTKYLSKKAKQLELTLALLLISIFFLLAGIGTGIGSLLSRRSFYTKLVNVSPATTLDGKVEAYTDAIGIFPGDGTAYLKLLEAYEDSGKFEKDESGYFLHLYNQNQKNFDDDDDKIAEMRYKAGRMYMILYRENGENPGLSTQIQKAAPFFAAAAATDTIYPSKTINDCSNLICEFYKTYVFSSTQVKDVDAEAMNELMSKLTSAIESISGSDIYDRLFLYRSVLNLVYDRRLTLSATGYDKEALLSLADNIYTQTKKMIPQQPASLGLKEEIESSYGPIRQALELAYKGGDS